VRAASSEVNVARYRLRFLLQEFDLPRGATLIGRSSDCHVTIEDPLVSRQHARIVIDGDDATLQDLGSRNGVKVNGVAIRGPARLKDGDRLRVGTQELVFCRVEQAANASAKTTGFLRHCAKCRLPYPQEVVACPNCGATEQLDEETLSGQFGASSQGSWSVQLLIEVLEKALSLSRVADAERILRRASTQVEERIVQREEVDGRQLATLADAAARVSLESGDPTWGCWAAQVYRRVPHIPDGELIERLAELVARHPVEIGEAVDGLATHCAAMRRPMTDVETAAIARLEQLRASLKDVRANPRGANPHLS
jgi:hypothetical protein